MQKDPLLVLAAITQLPRPIIQAMIVVHRDDGPSALLRRLADVRDCLAGQRGTARQYWCYLWLCGEIDDGAYRVDLPELAGEHQALADLQLDADEKKALLEDVEKDGWQAITALMR